MYRYMLQEVRDFENSAGDAGSIRGALYAQLRGSVYGCEQTCYRELGEDETIESDRVEGNYTGRKRTADHHQTQCMGALSRAVGPHEVWSVV